MTAADPFMAHSTESYEEENHRKVIRMYHDVCGPDGSNSEANSTISGSSSRQMNSTAFRTGSPGRASRTALRICARRAEGRLISS